jgi:hypothetical protein
MGCNFRASVIISRKQSSAAELAIGTQPDKWHNAKPHVWKSAGELWAGANCITSNTRTQERIATVTITWRLASKQTSGAVNWTQKTKVFGLGFFNVFINPVITSLEYAVFILLFILKLSDRFSRNLIMDFSVSVNITLPLFTVLQYVRTTRCKHKLLKSVRYYLMFPGPYIFIYSNK